MRKIVIHSLKSTIMLLFIPVIVLLVFVSGSISYQLASNQMKENSYVSLTDTLAQTRSYLNDRLNAVMFALTVLNNDVDTLSLMNHLSEPSYEIQTQDYIDINKIMDKTYNEDYAVLDSIFLSFNQNKFTMVKSDYFYSKPYFSFDDYFARYGGNAFNVYWQTLHESHIFKNLEEHHNVVSLFRLLGHPNSQIKGIILFQLRESFFRNILLNAKVSEHGYLLLASPDGYMSFKDVDDKYKANETLLKRLENEQDETGSFIINSPAGDKIVIVYDTLPVNRWKLAAIIPEKELLNKVNNIQYVSFAVMLLAMLVGLLLSHFLARKIAEPLSRLTKKVNKIEEGNLDVEFNVFSNNEIGVLNKGIGDLMHRVKGLLTQVTEEQSHKRMAELAALQAQINPHFLYNTLYSIKQLSEMGHNRKASQMVSALSNFFRISISKGSEIIPISEEIEHIRNYLLIQQMRYGDKFTYEMDVDPSILHLFIVKLTLQPLVENALYHGVKLKRGKGLIRIRGRADGEHVILQVEDNGAGMRAEQLEAVHEALKHPESAVSAVGFGVRNVQRRLQLHYGNEFGLTYLSEPGQGSVVTVLIRKVEEGYSCIS